MRARYPDRDGYVARDGVKIFYEIYGEGEQTILLLPTWSIFHSRHWKAQIPYLSRHFRVVTFDGRGNGRSDRPDDDEAYSDVHFVDDALAVLDEAGIDRAVVVGFSKGVGWALQLGGRHPNRVAGLALIGGHLPVGGPSIPERKVYPFDEPLDTTIGWAKHNRYHWLRDYEDWIRFFVSRIFTEPHSTKQFEDGVGWGLETDGRTILHTYDAPDALETEADQDHLFGAIACPVLVVHGSEDAVVNYGNAPLLAEKLGGTLVMLDGAGHAPHCRDPVKVNLLLRDFVAPASPQGGTWTRGKSRRKRALFVCSPIGLGHAQRDVAISKELKKLVPDLDVQWLAQDPVTRVLENEGESIHPASGFLANESKHIESESAEHDLHCFQAWRRMDEILIANFMLFHDVVNDENYDLWIGDEAWEVDYYLHENPEQKRAAYVWLTDFVGWLPMPDGGEHESHLTADYNAEMIEHIARFPRIRDRAIFIGTPDDIVPDSFGPGLPLIREWTEAHYDFSGGYITGFDPRDFSDREALRAELGYRPDEKVCIVTVGGSGVGGQLLRKVIASFPEAKARVPELRMIVVAGPRIDPESLPSGNGLEVRAYVHNLYRHLAACDLAVLQGGLSTSMELTANKRPFLYFPLRHHFEQNFHVRHRLNRYGSGRCMDFDESTPEVIADAVANEIGREVAYKDIEAGTTKRAAERIAEML
jgi:pimeloyl-ACP methyl ester carboxylesterase/predicted glycosyltransferase